MAKHSHRGFTANCAMKSIYCRLFDTCVIWCLAALAYSYQLQTTTAQPDTSRPGCKHVNVYLISGVVSGTNAFSGDLLRVPVCADEPFSAFSDSIAQQLQLRPASVKLYTVLYNSATMGTGGPNPRPSPHPAQPIFTQMNHLPTLSYECNDNYARPAQECTLREIYVVSDNASLHDYAIALLTWHVTGPVSRVDVATSQPTACVPDHVVPPVDPRRPKKIAL